MALLEWLAAFPSLSLAVCAVWNMGSLAWQRRMLHEMIHSVPIEYVLEQACMGGKRWYMRERGVTCAQDVFYLNSNDYIWMKMTPDEAWRLRVFAQVMLSNQNEQRQVDGVFDCDIDDCHGDPGIQNALVSAETKMMRSLLDACKVAEGELKELIASLMGQLEMTKNEASRASTAIRALVLLESQNSSVPEIVQATRDLRDCAVWRIQSITPMGDRKAFLDQILTVPGVVVNGDALSRIMQAYSKCVKPLRKDAFPAACRRKKVKSTG